MILQLLLNITTILFIVKDGIAKENHNKTQTKYYKMKKFIPITLLFAGCISFAHPTSEDIIMEDKEVDSLELAPKVAQTEEAFEAAINSAFTDGNEAKIAVYFDVKIDISLLGSEDLYSKSQAQYILQQFFAGNPPKSFNIIHKGNAKAGQYFIGMFTSKVNEAFRVNIQYKTVGGNRIVTSLTVEN